MDLRTARLLTRPRDPARAALIAAILLALSVAGCHSGGPVVDDRDVGAFTSDPSAVWGVIKGRVQMDHPYSAGSVTLCKKPSDQTVTLQAIEPVAVAGQIQVDGIGVRSALPPDREGPSNPAKYLVGTMSGSPRGLHDPAGYVVATTCLDKNAPVTEVVVTLTKTGPEGGALNDLRVTYSDGATPHELTMHFSFGLCGTGASSTPCQGAP